MNADPAPQQIVDLVAGSPRGSQHRRSRRAGGAGKVAARQHGRAARTASASRASKACSRGALRIFHDAGRRDRALEGQAGVSSADGRPPAIRTNVKRTTVWSRPCAPVPALRPNSQRRGASPGFDYHRRPPLPNACAEHDRRGARQVAVRPRCNTRRVGLARRRHRAARSIMSAEAFGGGG